MFIRDIQLSGYQFLAVVAQTAMPDILGFGKLPRELQ